AENRERVMVQ
nr:RecName: Full=Peptide 9797; AltName: Full=Peptide Ts20 [Tityus serrulatus]